MHWWSPVWGNLSLSGGETIMRPEWTKVVGKRVIDLWNAAARTGGVAGVRKAMAGQGVGFAGGGIVGKISGFASNVANLVSNPAKLLRSVLPDVAAALNGNVFGRTMTGLVGKLVDAVAAKVKSAAANVDGALVPSGSARGVMGYQAQAAWIRANLPGVAITSSFRPGAITATGNRSYHSMGRALDLAPSMKTFDTLRAAFGSSIKELIYSPAGSRQLKNGRPYFYGEPVRSMHFNHVHWAMRNGGMVPITKPMLFDSGGVLPPTRPHEFIPVQNFTGGNEILDRRGHGQPVDRRVFVEGNVGWGPEQLASAIQEADDRKARLTPPLP
jgi:hypothetical protein